jgi:hypothetical protein
LLKNRFSNRERRHAEVCTGAVTEGRVVGTSAPSGLPVIYLLIGAFWFWALSSMAWSQALNVYYQFGIAVYLTYLCRAFAGVWLNQKR